MTDIAFRMSENIDAISGAIAKAQAELENIDKTGDNPAFKVDGKASKYVKLGAVLDAVRPVFAKHGIAIVQMAVNGEGPNIGVVTMLAHAGQWIESRLYVAPMKFDAQGAGSALTYCRRYALMAMAGVAPDDDDGNAAVNQPDRSGARQPPSPQDDPFTGTPTNPSPVPASAQKAAPPSSAPGNGTAALAARGAMLPVHPEEPPEAGEARAEWARLAREFRGAATEEQITGIWERNTATVAKIKKYGGMAAFEGLSKIAQEKWDMLKQGVPA